MVFNETLAEPEVMVEEEVPICLYCTRSDYVKVGVSSSIIGLALFLSVGFCVWSRNQRYKNRLSQAEDEEEGKEETERNDLVGISGTI